MAACNSCPVAEVDATNPSGQCHIRGHHLLLKPQKKAKATPVNQCHCSEMQVQISLMLLEPEQRERRIVKSWKSRLRQKSKNGEGMKYEYLGTGSVHAFRKTVIMVRG